MKLSTLIERAQACLDMWGEQNVCMDIDDSYFYPIGDIVAEVVEDNVERILITSFETRPVLKAVK